MITTLSQAPDSIVLEPGQSLRTSVEAGAWLQLAEGRARVVSPPGWFGGTVFMSETLLDEGDVHRLPQGGWIEVCALTPVHLRVHAPLDARPSRIAAASASAPAEARPVMRFVRLLTGW
ncbi:MULTISPECIES: hypothetical protein [unclassified Variovorax]|jgi:hypothetical protein|uniref:hypothetical protein n=1 Tax=unclassified Variovorax TaxID=663243 RepID=UPI0008CB5924|nr:MULTISPECIES: hypothetical protein [unclassified Variovorax]SEJ00955.1 hypothetical protein SAMN05518853_101351 [Variovorax sp. OK202]SFB90990.1 hypothetical protein SAMN05444746_101351 [Variovorax sp. OK212]